MMKKTILVIFFVSLSPFLFSFISEKEGKQKVLKTIIVDAGHGIMSNGGYNGAKGSYSYEDVIALAVAKELVRQLHEAVPEVKIVETRPTE
jgi:N-acetylmuramoyl-L-alanine amidase